MSSRVTRSRARSDLAQPVGNLTEPQPEPILKRPAKRTKTSKDAKKTTPAKQSRKKGRLSVLPTLPLDVLFEIFAHIGPADLLHLARTTKSFRNVLLSRQSAFLWKSVYDSVEEIERFPCPEGVSLPVWVNLAYGGPWCDVSPGVRDDGPELRFYQAPGCSARANKVLWNLRRRLCKRCTGEVLSDTQKAFGTLGDDYLWMETASDLHDFIPNDYATRGHSSKLTVFYSSRDIQAYAEEIKELMTTYRFKPSVAGTGDEDGFYRALAELHDRKRASLSVIKEHARICEDVELTKSDMRSDELWQMKNERFAEIKKRLMALGVAEQDADSYFIRDHKEVNKSQPLTDRVWTRICPILRSEAKRLREQRLEREKRDRLALRQEVLREEYEHRTLKQVSPSMLCYVPNVPVISKFPRVADYLAEDVEDQSSTLHMLSQSVRAALDAVPGQISKWITRRQHALRNALPEPWPRPSFTDEDIAAQWPTLTDDVSCNQYAEIADLDLAVYTFKCSAPSCADDRVFYGLDILAHDCLHPEISRYAVCETRGKPIDYSLHAVPIPELHQAVARVVELLEMVPTKTRPLDLDRAGRIFTTDSRYPAIEGQPFMTWRQAVSYCGATGCQPTSLRLVTQREKDYVDIRHGALNGSTSLLEPDAGTACWGCAHCSSFSQDPGQGDGRWMCFDELQDHLETHGIDPDAAREGNDYLFNRAYERDSHIEHGLVVSLLREGVDVEEAIAFYQACAAEVPGWDIFDEEDSDEDHYDDFFGVPAFPFPSMFLDDLDDDEGFSDDEF